MPRRKVPENQLSLDFFASPQPQPQELVKVEEKTSSEPVRPKIEKRQGWALDFFKKVCSGGTYMVFLYGQNEHVCFARTHGSDDPGEDMPLMRKEAEQVLREHKYYLHSRYQGPDGGPGSKAFVYLSH